MSTVAIIAVCVVVASLLAAPPIFVLSQFVWHYRNTSGMAYFGRSSAQRAALREQLAARGRLLRPMLSTLSASMRAPNRFAANVDGVWFPSNNCNEESVRRATSYSPTTADVFVVTQMKCGTTWMLQCVYEILMNGEGDLSDDGHGHLCAVSPWFEAFNGVRLEDAPLLGPHAQRVIKTHLPPRSCPHAPEARYIYVTRHPVSCFRSTLDFFETLAGPFNPARSDVLPWFCSEDMWWGSWAQHALEGWQWSQDHDNVLFVSFEEMKDDLEGVVRKVATFLDIGLDDAALARVVRKAGFAFMKEHEDRFEMMPPSFFSVEGSFFVRGTKHHDEPVTEAERAAITKHARDVLGEDHPLLAKYSLV